VHNNTAYREVHHFQAAGGVHYLDMAVEFHCAEFCYAPAEIHILKKDIGVASALEIFIAADCGVEPGRVAERNLPSLKIIISDAFCELYLF